jgi:hypothetical protein
MMRHLWPIWVMICSIALTAALVLCICTLGGRPLTDDDAAALLNSTTEAAVWHFVILPAVGIK